uniref:Uncharacterized protein n=1 Tax=Strigamia maritima TaxID=126957 RepID=T1J0S2_STRMM
MKMIIEFSLALLCFVVAIIPIAFLLICLLLGEIVRQIIRLYLSLKHNRNITVVNGNDALLLISDQKTEVVGTVCLIFQGQLNLEAVKREFRTFWTDPQLNGHFLHPKLRCRPKQAYGYFYWIPEDDFSIDDHIQQFDCKPPENDSELTEILSTICNQYFPDNISPWKHYLFPLNNHPEPHYACVIRFHHCLMDSFNVVRMIEEGLLDKSSVHYLTPKAATAKNISEPSLKSKLLLFFITLFYAPFYLVKLGFSKDVNSLHGPKQCGKRFIRCSEQIDLKRVKRVGKMVEATVNDIMTSCVTAALKHYFVEQDEDVSQIHANSPISLHTGLQKAGFVNKLSGLFITLPVGRCIEPLDRLRLVHEELLHQKKSYYHYCANLIIELLINRLPLFMFLPAMSLNGSTLVITNVPLYQTQCANKFGDKAKECFLLPVHNSNMSVGVAVTSYNGKIRLTMSADRTVIDCAEKIEQFLASCIEEFEILDNLVKVNSTNLK